MSSDEAARARAIDEKLNEALRKTRRSQQGGYGTGTHRVEHSIKQPDSWNASAPASSASINASEAVLQNENAAAADLDAAATVSTSQAASAEMRRILSGLPEPEPAVSQALESGMEGPELDALIRRVWIKRQSDLRQAMNSARTEAQQMQELMKTAAGQPKAESGDVATSSGAASAATDNGP